MKRSIAGIIFRNGKFLIGKRLPTGEMASRWEFPGGKVDGDETPEISLLREFREEMAIDVSVGRLIGTAEFTNRNGPSELLAYEVSIPVDLPVELTEHSSVTWATMDEIERLEFVDSDRLLLPAIKEWYSL